MRLFFTSCLTLLFISLGSGCGSKDGGGDVDPVSFAGSGGEGLQTASGGAQAGGAVAGRQGNGTGGELNATMAGGLEGSAGNPNASGGNPDSNQTGGEGGLPDQNPGNQNASTGGEPSGDGSAGNGGLGGNAGGVRENPGQGGNGENGEAGNNGENPIVGGGMDPDCQPEAEQCNNLDDDCDGQTDENLRGEACEVQEQACVFQGMEVCRGGQFVCDVGEQEFSEEQCDGIDNDCDGMTDEDVVVEQECAIGQGVCEREGVTACIDGALTCDAEVIEPEQVDFSCNGQDNDCDGRIDEDYLGNPCEVGQGACRVIGNFVCRDGQQVCAAEEGDAFIEVCNGEDDDCDGRIDEEIAPRQCTRGRGICLRDGIGLCENGRTQCSAEPGDNAAPETCNGLDDDCDGNVDEFVRIEEFCTAGQGQCHVTRRLECIDGQAQCTAEPNFANQEPFEECNALDDDCDGETDEEVADQGDVCMREEENGCRDEGEWRCAAGRFYCSANPSQSRELCNGEDDDCDGTVDEDTGGGDCSVGVGDCRGFGTNSCVDGALVCDAVEGEPRDMEFCDNGDNDCDGIVDEDAEGRDCTATLGPPGGIVCREPGLTRCQDGFYSCEPINPLPPETCNGLDDDCDGETDENLFGDRCPLEDGVCFATPVQTCMDGEIQCFIQEREPSEEICNHLDDDCDGRWNEGFVGEACQSGLGICQAQGVEVCLDQRVQCEVESPVEPRPEGCNGVDDDCDGDVDEGCVD